nr:PREDICTED: coiled-coil domain-containing protein 63-like [Paralichthys olivaceus]
MTTISSKQPKKEQQSEQFKLPQQQRVMREEHQMKEQIRKQEQEIENLQKEQEDLKKKLTISLEVPGQDPTLLKKCDDIDEKMEIEIQTHKALEKEIAEMRLKVDELKERERKRPDIQKAMKSLQTANVKLDTVKQNFNKQRVENEGLREELRLIYNEHLIFKDEMNNLKKELEEVCTQTEKTIKETTDVEIEMVKADAKLMEMMAKQEKDIAEYTNQMHELNIVIAHQTRLTDFLEIKNRKRASQVDVRREKKLMMLKMDLERETVYLDSLRDEYQEILAVSREDDVDAAITKFGNEEKQGFLLLIDVMHQQKEILDLRKEIKELKNKPDHRDQKDLLDPDCVLNKSLEEVESLAKSNQDRSSAIIKFLDDIMPGVDHACSVLEIQPTGDGVMLDHYEKIIHYLGEVEEKTTEMLAIQQYLTTKYLDEDDNSDDDTQILLVEDPELLQPNTSGIHVIESEEDYDFSEDEQPLSLESLIKQVKEDMQKEMTADEKAKAKTPKAETQELKQMEEEQGYTLFKREKSKCPNTVAQWNKQLEKEREKTAVAEARGQKLKKRTSVDRKEAKKKQTKC